MITTAAGTRTYLFFFFFIINWSTGRWKGLPTPRVVCSDALSRTRDRCERVPVDPIMSKRIDYFRRLHSFLFEKIFNTRPYVCVVRGNLQRALNRHQSVFETNARRTGRKGAASVFGTENATVDQTTDTFGQLSIWLVQRVVFLAVRFVSSALLRCNVPNAVSHGRQVPVNRLGKCRG